MRRLFGLALLLSLLLPVATARAEQPRCPLPIDQCLARFDKMASRPWFGIGVDRDSATGTTTVAELAPDGPAARAGIRVGDIIKTIEGQPADVWFATRAGWKTAKDTPLAVVRAGQTLQVRVPVAHIPDDVLARAVGEHMLEAHLAYLPGGEHSHDDHH